MIANLNVKWKALNSGVTSFPAPTSDFRGKWNAALVLVNATKQSADDFLSAPSSPKLNGQRHEASHKATISTS